MNRNQLVFLNMVSATVFFILRHLIWIERPNFQSRIHQLQQQWTEDNDDSSSILQTSIPVNDDSVVTENDKHNDSENSTRDYNFAFGENKAYFYKYEPDRLPLPDSVSLQNAHGIYVSNDCSDQDHLECGPTIVITYQDKVDDSKCLLQWKAGEYDQPAKFLGPGSSLCAGVPHGLTAMEEVDAKKDGKGARTTTYLYHANNDQHLSKTTADGEVVWTNQYQPPVPLDKNSTEPEFKPTWFAGQPHSPYIYLADGYGTSRIYQYYKSNGTYAGRYFGGIGTDDGFFHTSHAISWDGRNSDNDDDDGHSTMIVCDRENHRLSYFAIDPKQPEKFEFLGQQNMEPYNLYQPCNIRYHPTTKQAIIPFLEGSVGIFNPPNPDEPLVQPLEGILNITDQMGKLGFLHPHDAHFLPNGDFVLVTWAPGRIGYFRKVEGGKVEEKKSAAPSDRDPFGHANTTSIQ
ncbi:unnamed protein product [Cylindrotheca closterium]|uniref:Uncharacterized protein n=1 Tax=Cylindrotheca closterium TaxID=2856 RepID=A0AAD2PW55_9STRA|nr:unnamed protein product [Cylindrotheca closterium]